MSLEAKIETLTQAVDRLTVALGAKLDVTHTIAADGKSGRATVGPKEAHPIAKTAPPAEVKKLTYDDVKPKILEVAKHAKEDATKILGEAQPGAARLPDILPANYGAVIAACDKYLATKKAG